MQITATSPGGLVAVICPGRHRGRGQLHVRAMHRPTRARSPLLAAWVPGWP